MEIRSILVNLDLNTSSPALITAAVDLAGRFGAELIGFAGAEPPTVLLGLEGGGASLGEIYAQERATIEEAIESVAAKFRASVPAQIRSQWRGLVLNPTDAVVGLARCADLIVTGTRLGGEPGAREIDVGDVLLRAGRPVLVTGAGVGKVVADKVVVGWKDSREARRAIADALPFLKAASEVLVVTVEEQDYRAEWSSINDVVHWLEQHGVKMRHDIVPMSGSAAETLTAAASAIGADLVVTGGYGHSRLREWLMGGVTADLLGKSTLNRLLSN